MSRRHRHIWYGAVLLTMVLAGTRNGVASQEPQPESAAAVPPCDIDPRPVWHVPGAMRGTAAADGDVVFALGRQHEVLALDAGTGRPRWQATTGMTSPTTVGSRLVLTDTTVVAGDGGVVAFDRTSGARVWVFDPDPVDVPGLHLGDARDDLVFTGSATARLHAVDVRTGTARWTSSVKAADDTVVFAPRVAGAHVVVAFTEPGPPDRGGLAAFDPVTGRPLWQMWFPAPERPWPAATWAGGGPVVWGDLVLASAGDGTVHAVSLEDGSWQWSLPPATGVWPPGMPPVLPPPVEDLRALAVSGDTLVIGSLTGVVTAVDLPSRTVRWEAADRGGGSVALAIAATGGLALVPHFSGHLVAFDLDDGRPRWRVGTWETGILWPAAVLRDRIIVTGASLGVVAYQCRGVPP